MKGIACPECGSTSWSQWISYSGTDLLKLTPGVTGYALAIEGRKYNEEGDGWVCENDHLAEDDDLIEHLDDARSNA